jgi:hypothetical protein
MSKKITQYYNIKIHRYKDSCAGLNCSNKPITILKVKYINKIGYFCQKCKSDLLQLDLVEEIPKEGFLNA